MAATSEPAKPSQVLPGLMTGASLCLPNLSPDAYAPTSVKTTMMSDASVHHSPCSDPVSAT